MTNKLICFYTIPTQDELGEISVEEPDTCGVIVSEPDQVISVVAVGDRTSEPSGGLAPADFDLMNSGSNSLSFRYGSSAMMTLG